MNPQYSNGYDDGFAWGIYSAGRYSRILGEASIIQTDLSRDRIQSMSEDDLLFLLRLVETLANKLAECLDILNGSIYEMGESLARTTPDRFRSNWGEYLQLIRDRSEVLRINRRLQKIVCRVGETAKARLYSNLKGEMDMKQFRVEDIEGGIRAGAFIDAADFFRDSDPTVAKILEEFARRAVDGLDIVPPDEAEDVSA